MIDTTFVEQRMRDVNPVPSLEDVDADELSRAVTAAHARTANGVESHMHLAVTELQPITQRTPRGRKVWAFAAAFVVIAASIGIATLLLRNDDAPVADEPSDEISVDSLQWSRVTLAAGGLNIGMDAFNYWTSPALLAEGGPGLVAAATVTSPGERDLAWTTADGYEWAESLSEDENGGVFDIDGHVAGIASGSNLMVVAGGDRAWTSPDGITWTGVPDRAFGHSIEIQGVIAGGPGFVAFGEDRLWGRGAIWTSSDGTNWTRAADDPALSSGRINAITAGGPGLVAVGSDRESCEPVVWTSIDGQEWTRTPYDPEVFGSGRGSGFRCNNAAWISINDLTAGGPGLVAVGSYQEKATVWTSPDGVTWTRGPYDPEVFGTPPDMYYSDIRRVAAVGDELMAIGWRGGPAAVWTSPDGLAWTDITNEIDPGHDELVMDSMMMDVLASDSAVFILGVTSDDPAETVVWIGSPSEPLD